MLSFRLRLADIQGTGWCWDTDRWASGESWIRPAHAAVLDAELVPGQGASVCALVREDKDGEADYTSLLLRPDEIQVSAGVFGTAPMYLVAVGEELYGSWDLADLRPHLRPDRLNPRAVARTLSRQHRYSADTLFEGVYRLTERATAVFTPAGLTIVYPEPAQHVLQPRSLRAGVDPVDAFDALLTEVVAEWRSAARCVGVELSGGADSGNVALSTAAAGFGSVHSFGLLMDGRIGLHQRHRRRAVVEHLGLRDTAVPAMQHPPFVPGGVRGRRLPHDPAGAFYQEAFDVVRAQAATRGCEVIFTGGGGDEVNAHHSRTTAELPTADPIPWLGGKATQALAQVNENLAPIPALPVPTLMAFGLHNPAYLRLGIWPVAPLVHPRVVRFMEQLPHEHRRGKAMFRDRLRRAGLPESVAAPTEPENFLAVMESGLRTHGLPLLDDMLRESLLVDLGYVDPDALAQARDHAERAPVVPDLLCDTLALEVGLRSLA
ncbi:asparagine synthase-related protein [Streptomyces sp. NBC_00201]|uniref:asparagine synthase-related protein n=1 Tax=unclassified Streptomyces TaxID=2593676 RepID=UPI002252BA24|nr:MULTISPECIES: asparagine synthase-related protein [unclassified Streptomyces]MCX5052027.1 asparagine synthase-related protein [Streptomyces sp. NBC_00474]MCX5249922.1 asparagine synthase-related protein [Streptomyces sp. NBC_00201]